MDEQKDTTSPLDIQKNQALTISAVVFFVCVLIVLPGLLTSGDRFQQILLGGILLIISISLYKFLQGLIQQSVFKRPFIRIEQAGMTIGYPGSTSETVFTWDQLEHGSIVGLKSLSKISPARLIAIKLRNPPANPSRRLGKLRPYKYFEIKDGWILMTLVGGRRAHQLSITPQELAKAITLYSGGRVPIGPEAVAPTDNLPKQLQPMSW